MPFGAWPLAAWRHSETFRDIQCQVSRLAKLVTRGTGGKLVSAQNYHDENASGTGGIGDKGELGTEQNYHNEKRKLNPAIAAKSPLMFVGFQASNLPQAQINRAQAAMK